MTTIDEPTTATDQAALAELPQRIVAAWARHDAEAFADVFTDDGSMILPGVYRTGRSEIAAFMAEAFAGPYRGTQVTGDPVDLRFITPDVALITTVGGVLEPGQTELPASSAVRASWLATRDGAGWRLAAYQNSPRD